MYLSQPYPCVFPVPRVGFLLLLHIQSFNNSSLSLSLSLSHIVSACYKELGDWNKFAVQQS